MILAILAIYTGTRGGNAGAPGVFIALLGTSFAFMADRYRQGAAAITDAKRRRRALATEIELNLREIRGVIANRRGHPGLLENPMKVYVWQTVLAAGDLHAFSDRLQESLEEFYGVCDTTNSVLQGLLLRQYLDQDVDIAFLVDELEGRLLVAGPPTIEMLLPDNGAYPQP